MPDASHANETHNSPTRSDAEWAVRRDLAAAYRLVAWMGWDDLIFTHLSVRVPETPYFLINPYGFLFEEITASSLVKIDIDGNKVEDTPYIVNPAGFVIHSAIHAARTDAHAVMHLHSNDGQAVSAQAGGLLPITQTSMLVWRQVAYHGYEGLATNLEERARLVADLSDKTCMLLRNHGTLTVGVTVAAAFLRMYLLERACTAQVRAQSGGGALNRATEESIAATAGAADMGLALVGNDLLWPALIRKLDRTDPSYRD